MKGVRQAGLYRPLVTLLSVLIATLALAASGLSALASERVRHPAPRGSATADADHDHLPDLWEVRLGLDPQSPDTDGDGILDGDEDADGDRLSNRFEVHSTHTDPRRVDSDLDGIRDGAEDPDRDRLSNAGEQRFGTRPRAADSDGDGTDDWHEDSDRDGRPDGLEQDAGPVPSGLNPTLAAPLDRPARYVGCHQQHGRSRPIVCTYGSGRHVVLFGDSHALQWRGAMERLADARGWRLYVITKSACPVAAITLAHSPDCARWRRRAMVDIDTIGPRLLVVSNRDQYTASDSTGNADNQHKWRAGLRASLRALGAPRRRVILLGDTSRFGDAPACLTAHPDDMSACSIQRARAVSDSRIARDRSVASSAGAGYRSTVGLSCPYDPCPVVIDRMLVAYDAGHLTYAFGRSLWRGLAQMLPRV